MLMVEAADTWDTTDGLRSNSRASSVSNSRSASNADLAEGGTGDTVVATESGYSMCIL
jgi:hypothetical protein